MNTHDTSTGNEGLLGKLRPLDEYNQALRAHVHPPGWRNPEPKGRYNLVVIGAGTAGLVTAAGAAGLGAKVALVERDLMGGDCLISGCVPSKALIRSARAAHDVASAAVFGIASSGSTTANFHAVMQRLRRLRSQISAHDAAARFRELGIDVYLGEGRFLADRHILVGDQQLSFARAVIATGARAADPGIDGLADVGYHTNETIFSLTELPARLAVIGAGPIGCEMAQAFARLGSQVTLIERGPQILSREDPDAAHLVDQALRNDRITIIRGAERIRASRAGGDKVLHVRSHNLDLTIPADAILVGAGRKPNVEGLDLERAGVVSNGMAGVQVDDHLRTTNRRIYAAGDVCSRFKFTHAADSMARIVIQNALFFGRAKLSRLVIPWCTYTDPEIAHVGLYEDEARQQGIDVHTILVTLDRVDRAVLDGEEAGLLKVHLRRGSDRILGATLVARHAGEMISELTLAMTAGLGLTTIARTIHPYPTQAEAIKKAADAYNRTRLTPFIKRLCSGFLAWRR